jgi:hypothetical protein
MADPKFEAHQLAIAAAHGVAIALSHRPGQSKQEFHLPPHIICGLPKFLFEAVLQADREGLVSVKSVTPTTNVT